MVFIPSIMCENRCQNRHTTHTSLHSITVRIQLWDRKEVWAPCLFYSNPTASWYIMLKKQDGRHLCLVQSQQLKFPCRLSPSHMVVTWYILLLICDLILDVIIHLVLFVFHVHGIYDCCSMAIPRPRLFVEKQES